MTTTLPTGYVHIDEVCALHLSTIRSFTSDFESFMAYLAIAIEYPSDSYPDSLFDIVDRCNPLWKPLKRIKEHGALMNFTATFLRGGDWLDDQPKPYILASVESLH